MQYGAIVLIAAEGSIVICPVFCHSPYEIPYGFLWILCSNYVFFHELTWGPFHKASEVK